ncbi:MAG TPA: glycosyltransferase [Candidatus Thermoplasmatota archaeon]|nr:glycosyltransferase [Candidatus Thermoplasmatota archaeon]
MRKPELHVVQSVQVWLPRTQTWLHNQVRHLPTPVRSTVVADALEPNPAWQVADVRRLRPSLLDRVRRRKPEQARTSALARTLARTGARLLHSHFGNVGWHDLAAARQAGVAHVVSFYGQDLTRYPRIAPAWAGRYRELLDSGAQVLCEGPHMAEVARSFGGPASRVRVHHLGIDLSGLPCKPRARAPGEPLRILMAASFREKKGLPDAIRALGEVATATRIPLEATLVGDAEPGRGPSQEEKARIEAAIAQSGLGPRLRRTGFLGHTELLAEAYRHHVFLAPSRTASDGDTEGGAPVGLIEMAATGLQVVSTRHCDIPHVLPASCHDLLAGEGDVPGLAARIEAVAEGPEAWRDRAAAARARIEAEFDARAQGARLGAIYAELAP